MSDLRELILSARQTVAHGVNAALVMLNWKVGERIRVEILHEMRADYGEEIVPTLSAQLTPDFGDGFSTRNIFRMMQFAEMFPEQQIVATLSREFATKQVSS